MGLAPVEKTVPTGPIVQETSGRKAPARTYQDLLKTAYVEALFEHHFQSQIYRTSIEGVGEPIGKPDVIRSR